MPMNTAAADTHDTEMPRARVRQRVMLAVRLQWLSLLLVVPGSHDLVQRDGVATSEIVAVVMLAVAVQVMYHWALSTGRNWARLLFLGSTLFGLPFAQDVLVEDYLAHPLIGMATGLSVMLSLVSAWLLFAWPGWLLFTRRPADVRGD